MLALSACVAGRPNPDGPTLPDDFTFSSGSASHLFVTDVTSLGDIDRRTSFTYVNLETKRFIDVGRRFTGRRGGRAILITEGDDGAVFTANATPPGFVVFAAIQPLRAGSPRPLFERRAPVFELKAGEAGVFSLLTAEVGLEAQDEDPRAMLRAAQAALAAYPGIDAPVTILRPVAFIDFRGEGPGFAEFEIVEDRRAR